ncbi:putative ABC transport system permease protein [Povalibacter uvarum]|uniref:Putative ABC transport system permease protein n=1 Tax=Povalibacter uvarum TaxID=732238 RepID=A0A841HK64_9GAMM|nr:FtsX-like permease family protein [Povalibacter uvarum]MBB6092974.1 putative ABC transport system permease protein [Povalibacter uvarum]
MKALRLAFLALIRDAKSGELGVLALALLVAVSALTAVGFFTSRVSGAVDQQAGEVLAADLRVRSPNPIDREYFELATSRGLVTAELATFPSVVLKGDDTALTALRAVTSKYPLRGRVKVTDVPFGEAHEVDAMPGEREVWPEVRMLAQLNANVGDRITVGSAEFTITKILDYRPDQGAGFVDLAPSMLMRMEDLPATGLVQPGSRISYAALFAGDANAIKTLKQELETRRKAGERIVDLEEASPQIRSAIDRAGRFLNLSALVTILLAAIAVAIAARRYVVRHLDTAALMKSMGAPQSLVLQISVLELLMIGLLAGAIGTAIGFGAQAGIAILVKDLVRGVLPPPTLDAMWLGLMTSVLMLVGFALPPLLQLRSVPPARVLRRNLEPPPLRYITVYGMAIGALVGLLAWLLRDAKLLVYVLAATAATFAVLIAAGWLLVRVLGGLRGSVGVAWRYGMANIARRGRDSIIQIVAFGLGLMVLLLLALVRNDLMQDWRASLPADAPNHFMINIRPDQAPAIQQFMADRNVAVPQLVPMIRARLTGINKDDTANMTIKDERGRDFLDREANLTWAKDLQTDNRIVAGTWWTDATTDPQVSVEIELANSLGLKLGDELTYDVAGETVKARVTSFREVKWDSFRPNFFMVFSPGVLDAATGTLITSVHIPTGQRAILNDFIRQFPEVVAIDLEAILAQVRGVMDKATLAVQYVFGFTLLAGVTVLLAAIQSTRDERRYESAMLRTLGASRMTVLQGVAAEFTTLGLLAGTLAAFGASAAGYFLATELFNLKYTLNPLVWLVGLASGALLVGLSGTWAARSVVNHPPIATLRGG